MGRVRVVVTGLPAHSFQQNEGQQWEHYGLTYDHTYYFSDMHTTRLVADANVSPSADAVGTITTFRVFGSAAQFVNEEEELANFTHSWL